MRAPRGRAALWVGALSLLGCGQGAPSAPAPASRGLEPGVVARVGDRAIAADAVGRIAGAQQIDVAAARDLAIRDAVLAEGAREQGLDQSLDVILSQRAALARRLLRELHAEAEKAEITDEEVRKVEGSRTVHAVVRFDATAPEDKRKKAMALAEAIHAAVLPLQEKAAEIQDEALVTAFQQAIAPIEKGDLEVTVEPLPAVTAEGRVLAASGGTFDPAFARAAAALGRRGEASPVTVSSFGAHVIVLLDRTPPLSLPAEERRRLLREDIVTARARAAEERLLAGLRANSARERDADALLSLVAVDP